MTVNKATLETVVNLLNNTTAGGFTVTNIKSIYETEGKVPSPVQAAATVQAFSNLASTMINTALAAVQSAEAPITSSSTASQIASQNFLTEVAGTLGKANFAISALGISVDAYNISSSMADGTPVKLSDGLSLASNISGALLSLAAVGVTVGGIAFPPLLLATAAAIAIAAGGASIYVAFEHPDQGLWDTINDLANNGLSDFGWWVGNWILGIDENDLEPWTEGVDHEGKYHIVYDPLVLDLDGDGIETIGAGDDSSAMFDHDKDGIRTATGWVNGDDGILVFDKNGDNIINDGNELFGDNYELLDGTNAAHGFAALAELDTNSDGVVDANDENFGDLKVWRDLNQDGVSQVNELFSLDEVGIKSLNLSYEETSVSQGDGNTLTHLGSYTKEDGSSMTMGDIDFNSNSEPPRDCRRPNILREYDNENTTLYS